jgi:hypothetical protein
MSIGTLAFTILAALQPAGRPTPTHWTVWPRFARMDAEALIALLDQAVRPTLLACLQEPASVVLLSADNLAAHACERLDREISNQLQYLRDKRAVILESLDQRDVRLETSAGATDVPYELVERLFASILLPCPITLRVNESGEGPPMRLRIRLPTGAWTA